MATFVVTYSIVWLALVLYVIRLGVAQRRLMQQADALQSRLAKHESRSKQTPKQAA